MKTARLFLLTSSLMLLCIASAFAQRKLKVKAGCNFTGIETEKEYFEYDPSLDAKLIVKQILQAANISDTTNFILMASNVSNAMAIQSGTTRYILYNPKFLEDFKKDEKTRNAAFAVLAHEIGHHILGHEFNLNDPVKVKEQELGADKFAGSVLYTLCVSREDASSPFDALPAEGSKTHPSRGARTAAVTSGWVKQQEYWKGRGVNPCQIEFVSRATLAGSNAGNVRCVLDNKKISFTYNVGHAAPGYKSYVIIKNNPPNAPLPASIRWLDDPAKPGSNKKAVWEYQKDGYTRAQLENPDIIGIVHISPDIIPKPASFREYLLPGGLALAGIGLGVAGLMMRKKALDDYDTYKNVTDPEDITWAKLNTTRSEYFSTTNGKFKTSSYLLGGSALCLAGTVVTSITNKIFRKAPVVNIYCANGKTKISAEPMLTSRHYEVNAGVRLRF